MKHLILRDRNNFSAGYREVSAEVYRNYKRSVGKDFYYYPYLNGVEMEVTEEAGKYFEKCERRERYVRERSSRKGRLLHYDALDCEDFLGADIIADTSDSIEEIYERKELTEIVRNSIFQLAPRDQELVRMLFYCCMTETEVAAQMNISQSAVNQRKNRTLKKMKKFLEKCL